MTYFKKEKNDSDSHLNICKYFSYDISKSTIFKGRYVHVLQKPKKFIKYTSKRNNLMTYNIIIWNRRNEDYKQFLFFNDCR